MRAWILLSIPLGLVLSFGGGGPGPLRPHDDEGLDALVERIDRHLAARWRKAGVTPAPEVDSLQLARRLWLDLLGTIPSLEEIRALEAQPPERRRAWLLARVERDPRYPEVLAERLARIAVGGPMARQDDLLYRRRRLVAWLTRQVRGNRPWDELVRELITAKGLSTGQPATNFVVSQERDPLKLAARSTRAFLGVRIDCAQCHDHPFARWKQTDFEGLAAFFARTEADLGGVRDVERGELEIDRPLVETPGQLKDMREEAATGEGPVPAVRRVRQVFPQVPFAPELLPADAPTRRAAYAAWITHPENPFFAKALVNRLWQWLMGRGLVEPLDELDSTKPRDRELLDLLARDFVAHGFDVKRTVAAIVRTRAYRLDSRVPEGQDEDEAEEELAAYPLKPLRADQLANAIYQASSLWTYDRRRNLILRLARFLRTAEFSKRNGDDLALEEPTPETLLQRLQLLNGKLVTELTQEGDGFSPIRRSVELCPDEGSVVDTAFLLVLTRRASPEERAHFAARLRAAVDSEGHPDADARARVVADLYWTLLNTTEFAWAH
ncbi:MAG: DUF1553 domain-containing protein [Planctomycetota bacterium]|nr:MAG: DUF1553 domain-containing protein [Planctomycetota bacterium]